MKFNNDECVLMIHVCEMGVVKKYNVLAFIRNGHLECIASQQCCQRLLHPRARSLHVSFVSFYAVFLMSTANSAQLHH